MSAVSSGALRVRPTSPDDLGAISDIHAHHVRTGVATFELTAPDLAEWLRRFDGLISSGLPFLTATLDGEIVGYAYCAPWKTRPAYRHTVEDSVYVAPHAGGRGVGGHLLDALLADCERRASARSSPSLSTRMGRLRLRCTAIADSSTPDGSARSATSTAGGSIPSSFSGV